MSKGMSEVSERANEWVVRENEWMDERVLQSLFLIILAHSAAVIEVIVKVSNQTKNDRSYIFSFGAILRVINNFTSCYIHLKQSDL